MSGPRTFATRDAAQLAGMTETQVRAVARTVFLRPDGGRGRAYRFSFQDLVLLRSAGALIRAGVPARRVGLALRTLRDHLPHDRALSAVHIAVENGEIVARDGAVVWKPESRQLFVDPNLSAAVVTVAKHPGMDPRAAPPENTPDAWCLLGLELEPASIDDARHAFERALAIDPDHADARVNLGRLLHAQGEADAAIEQYEIVLAGGEHAIAAYNLGLALDSAGRLLEACAAYERAVRADPALAEPHYNLARLADAAGDDVAAVRHLKAYRDLVTTNRSRR